MIAPLICIISGTLADVVTTQVAYRVGAAESRTLGWLYRITGPLWWLARGGLCGFGVVLVSVYGWAWVGYAFGLFYVAIAIWNLRTVRKQRRLNREAPRA